VQVPSIIKRYRQAERRLLMWKTPKARRPEGCYYDREGLGVGREYTAESIGDVTRCVEYGKPTC